MGAAGDVVVWTALGESAGVAGGPLDSLPAAAYAATGVAIASAARVLAAMVRTLRRCCTVARAAAVPAGLT